MQQTSNLSKVMQLTQYSSLLTTSILLFLLQTITTVESATSHNHKNNNNNNNLNAFIKKSCRVTLYSDLCYSSLSSSYKGDPDLGKLTYAAIKISHDQATQAASYVAGVSKKTNTAADGAVRDCVGLTKDAVVQVEKSLNEMARVLRAGGGARNNKGRGKKRRRKSRYNQRLEVSNVQTWMSAAITDQNTCVDGFDEVGGGGKDEVMVKNEVSGKVGYVVKFISNALALVNSFLNANH